MADLFENAGINSVKELAQRNPVSLHKALADDAKKNPALHVKEPSADQAKALVTKAALSIGSKPVDTRIRSFAAAESHATGILHGYIDTTLFGQHPEAQAFRTAVRDHRPQSEWPALQQRGHDEVATFFRDAERIEKPDS